MKERFTAFVKISGWLIASLGVLFVLGYILSAGDYAVAKTARQDPAIPHVTLEGITFHTEAFGNPDKPTVIVIHGGPGGDYRYLLPLKALADDYHIVFYDQRGTGLSPRVDPKEVTLETSISDLDLIKEHYAPGEQVHLIGHSWGAMLGTAYIAHHPHKVASAVIAEPGPLTSEALQDFFEATAPRVTPAYLFQVGRAFFESLHVRGPDKQAKWDHFGVNAGNPESYQSYYCGGKREGYTFPYWRWGILAAQNLVRSGAGEDGHFKTELFTEGLEHFQSKVLFVVSECNQLTGLKLQQEQMKFFPNAELAIIPETGHEMFTEDPEASLAVVRAYLEKYRQFQRYRPGMFHISKSLSTTELITPRFGLARDAFGSALR